jgi:hypothetical protein
MKIRRDLVTVALATFCLTTGLFMIHPTKSNPGIGEYDPWADLNNDGIIDIYDAIKLADAFDTSGTPINKTTLISDFKDLRAGLLLPLPCPGTWYDGKEMVTDAILAKLDLDPDTPGEQQTVFARQGTDITVTGEFQLYCYNIGDSAQAFFIYSWTPNLPPTSGYYHAVYSGSPGGYPGVTQTFNFNITLPTSSEPYAMYYLYFCTGLQFSVEDAVSLYTTPLTLPCAVIVAGT